MTCILGHFVVTKRSVVLEGAETALCSDPGYRRLAKKGLLR